MSNGSDNTIINIRNNLNSLSPILEKVGTFIVSHPDYVMKHSISELAKLIDTSEASITRFCRTLGYKGFIDFKVALTLDQGANKNTTSLFEKDVELLINNILDTNKILNTEILNHVAQILHNTSNIHILATGSASPVGLFLQLNLLRIGKQANFSELSHSITYNLPTISDNHLIIVIYNGECSADMLHSLALAKQNGIKIVTITKGSIHMLGKLSDWNLTAAVPCSNQLEQPLADVIGNLFIVDRLIAALMAQDDNYQLTRKENAKSVFSIDSVAAKLAELFMS